MKKVLFGLAVGLAVGYFAHEKSSKIKSIVEKGKKKLESLKD